LFLDRRRGRGNILGYVLNGVLDRVEGADDVGRNVVQIADFLPDLESYVCAAMVLGSHPDTADTMARRKLK
jgi:hypothetical protein